MLFAKCKVTRGKTLIAAGLLGSILVACSAEPASEAESETGAQQRPAFIATVELAQGQSPAEAAAELRGSVINLRRPGLRGNNLNAQSVDSDTIFIALDSLPVQSLSADGDQWQLNVEPNLNRFVTANNDRPYIADGDSTVWADGDSTVWADGDSTVWADGDSTVWADGDSTVWADGDSTVWADGDSTVWADGDSTVWADGDSTVWADYDRIYRWVPPNTGIWNQIELHDGHKEARKLGFGVLVAVIDTGVDVTHPWLSGAISDRGYNFVDGNDDPGEVGTPEDFSYGHGTSVAGIVRQIAPRAEILPIRALSADGSGDVLHVVEAVYYAVDEGAHIINLSLGTDPEHGSPALEAALDYATSQGVYVTTTAGNHNLNQLNHPASIAHGNNYMVSVTSVDLNDNKSYFANYHNQVGIAAPGERVYGPYPAGRGAAAWSGTSMAAPVVAGAIALALGERLDVQHHQVIRELRHESDDDIYDDGKNSEFRNQLGKGRIDVEEFLDEVLR